MSKANKKLPVLVCTDRRGVFFGWVDPAALEGDDWRKALTLTDCRMAVYWSVDVHGVLGLAVGGPTAACRITPAVGVHHVTGVHGVTECTKAAVQAWESEPWE